MIEEARGGGDALGSAQVLERRHRLVAVEGMEGRDRDQRQRDAGSQHQRKPGEHGMRHQATQHARQPFAAGLAGVDLVPSERVTAAVSM